MCVSMIAPPVGPAVPSASSSRISRSSILVRSIEGSSSESTSITQVVLPTREWDEFKTQVRFRLTHATLVSAGGTDGSMVAAWFHDGRKCQTWLLSVVVVSVPLLILVQASLGWCTAFLGCFCGLVCLCHHQLEICSQRRTKIFTRSPTVLGFLNPYRNDSQL